MKRDLIYDHAPDPGPLYWDFKCRVCARPVAEHAGFLRRLWHHLRKARGR